MVVCFYKKVKDLDLCVSTELFEDMKRRFDIDLSSKNDCGFYRLSDLVEVVVNDKKDFHRDFKDGYPVEPLQNILVYKVNRNLPKDQVDIDNIKSYLNSQKNR